MANTQPPEDLTTWFRGRLNTDVVEEEGIINRLELYHAVEGEGGEILGSVRVSDNSDHHDISQEIWDMAEQDSTTRVSGMIQRYVVIAYRAGGDDPDCRRAFTLTGKAMSNLLGGETEGPTSAGHLGQLMRHNEKTTAMLNQQTEIMSGRLIRELETERKRRMTLEDREMDRVEAIQDLSDRKHERDMEIARELKRQERHDEMMGMVLAMAPLVMSKFLGGAPTSPQLPAAGARDESTHQFLKSLTQEEAMNIIGVLPPAKQMVLMEMYKTHQEAEAAKIKAQEERSASSPLKKDKDDSSDTISGPSTH